MEIEIIEKTQFRCSWEIHKEWTGPGVSVLRATTHRCPQGRGYSCCILDIKPLLNWKQCQKRISGTSAHWSKVLFSDESWRLEEEWRDIESNVSEDQYEVSTVSDNLGWHFLCWCWATVLYQVQSQHSHLPGDFRAHRAFICWQALGRYRFPFPAGCAHTKTVLLVITVLH